MSKELQACKGDEFRIICPLCKVTWSTCSLPSECPDCGATVTVQARKLKPEQGDGR